MGPVERTPLTTSLKTGCLGFHFSGMYQGRNFGLQFRLGAISARSSFGQLYTAITMRACPLVLNHSSVHPGADINLAGAIWV